MTIPKYNELFGNVLSLFSDETEEYKTRYVKKIVADLLNLSPEERNQLKEGKNEPLIEYHLGWTLTYLKKAGLLENKRRGYVNITKLGLNEIKENPNLTEKDLYKFPSFVEFKRGNKKSKDDVNQSKLKKEYTQTNLTENLEKIFNNHNSHISNDLLKIILSSDIAIFEKLINDLILKLKFHDVNLKLNDSNEIEGLFNQDEFGLDKIAVHAVNKSDEINISDLQQFAGFIVSNGLKRGVFITTSLFNGGSYEYIENQTNLNISLIDGKKLSKLIIENNVCTNIIGTYELKSIDKTYFNL